MSDWLIYFLGFIAILSACYVLFTSNLLYAAFSLVVTFISIALLYLALGAEFIAVTQIMIYVGGIIVLIIFGVMLTNKLGNEPPQSGSHNKFIAGLISASIFGLLCYAIVQINFSNDKVSGSLYNIKQIGQGLFTDYLLVFELAGILLLVALIGASVIASKKDTV
ncbi:NADH-quinone oxidoreductase subunit J family protein [Fulvivirga lutea]|uniref:NADH-quinone oxidoreductase subunit J n=1 Tax=Fulvivirga lutea TaxID=2810512 RepID=A0A974WE74_9BACT|nr:NADH-quinone oxidoreductase subunit J [Fulvivirga lutea]QSE95944.1 NADH-quinone oxidoreductase subunit J [Fulvivirga lutea]